MEVSELRGIFLFTGLSDEQIGELIAHSEEFPFDAGQVLFVQGDPADFWWVLLEGRVELLRRAGREESVVATMDRPGVWAGGFRAWADSAGYLATGRAAGAGRMLRVPAASLGELVRTWFPFGIHMIEGFFQTVRNMEAMSRQREALVALGGLAAGLAHELNNPAAATVRAVDAIEATCNGLLASLVLLAERSLSAAQFITIESMRGEIDPPTGPVDPIAVADREDALLVWLDAHGLDDGWRIAPALAAAGVEVGWCQRVADVLDPHHLGPALDWTAGTLSLLGLLQEVKESTGRVSALVAAVKSYSQLDRASLQVIDITEGIESTLVMLNHKLKTGVTVVRDYDAELPLIEANPGELNQVWTNLIDNAIDAMDGKGTLRVSARPDGEYVVVEVADTGPGIRPEVQARAFEAFYTTKDVSKGTGLGLDASRRIVVERHHGEISIESPPSGALLRVRLPLQHTPRPG